MRHINTLGLLAFSATLVVAQNLGQSYAPVYVDCPSDVLFTRSASEGLNPEEETWLHNRKRVAASALSDYLSRANMKNFDIDRYISALNRSNYAAVPAIGLAISGGGYASAIMGAGVMRALDAREEFSNAAGTGGLLQSMAFLSGQSGGTWAPLSFTAADYPTADELLESWQPQIDRFTATSNSAHAATLASVLRDVADKARAGFNVSVADFIGRVNGYEFIKGPEGGLNVTMSGIKELPKFKSHQMPLPILQIAQVTDDDPSQLGLLVPTSKSPIFEITPYEFGTWMQPVASFAAMEYLGTNMIDGKPVNNSACVKGFDRVDFIIGASANAYEFWYLESKSNGTLGLFPKRSDLADSRPHERPSKNHKLNGRLDPEFPPEEVEEIEESFKELFGLDLDGFTYTRIPNPFRGQPNPSRGARDARELKMVDATEVESSLPLAGQLARNASFIIAWDDNSDAWPNGWQNGTNLHNAYLYFKEKGVPFPVVPSPATFIARNYTTKPAFFGCNANLNSTNDTRAPIVAWFGNAPYSSYTNITFFQTTTTIPRVHDIWNNTFNQITQGAGSLDPEWSACLACAAIDRSLTKLDPPMQRSGQCENCFARYCWDGFSAAESHGSVDVDPTLVLNSTVTYAEWNATVGQALQRGS